MRYVVTAALAFLSLGWGAFLYARQVEPQRYTYKVTGAIIRNEAQRLACATVYVMRKGRPLQGRLICTHAKKDGTFSITFTNEPGEYCVSAHTGETGGFIPLALPGEDLSKKPPVYFTDAAIVFLDADHREGTALLKFRERTSSPNQNNEPSITFSGPEQVPNPPLIPSALASPSMAENAAAQNGDWRTSENSLHLLGLFGGWPGALIAQKFLHHKSKKRSFQVIFWATVLLNCAGALAYAWLANLD
jgi:uncharacterized membrane protein YsdA (DUF1294 family)